MQAVPPHHRSVDDGNIDRTDQAENRGHTTDAALPVAGAGLSKRDIAKIEEQQHQHRRHSPVPFPPGPPGRSPPYGAGRQADGREKGAGRGNRASRYGRQRMPPHQLHQGSKRNTRPAAHAEPCGGHVDIKNAHRLPLQIIRRCRQQPAAGTNQDQRQARPEQPYGQRARNLEEAGGIGETMHQGCVCSCAGRAAPVGLFADSAGQETLRWGGRTGFL